MVWFFHLIILLGISLEKGDFFSLALFAVDSLVLSVHLYIEWTALPCDRNKKMLRWWYPCFIAVFTLIGFRYLSFYTRYLTVRNMFTGNNPTISTYNQFQSQSLLAKLLFKID